MSGVTRVLLVLVLLSVRTALALDPERDITELMHRVWDSKYGVPADIRAFAQTSDGYLWIGSYHGLYRFDGIRFQKFQPESGPPLPSNRILGLFAAADNRLWIGYHAGGVSVLEAGKVINYSSVDGFPEGAVWTFAQDQRGRIWAASSGGLACLEGGRWRKVGDESNFPGSAAYAVLVDRLGALWVAGEHQVAVLRPQASKFESADEPYNGQVRRLAESPDGTVWMAETTRAVRPLERPGQGTHYTGLSRADCSQRFPETWQTEPRCRRPDDLEVRVGSVALLFDKDGNLWITTLGDGLRRAPYPLQLPKKPIGEFDHAVEHFTSKDGLSSDTATAIFEDREGNIWIGTADGLDQFRDTALAPVTLGSSTSIVPGDAGYVFAVANRRLFRFHDARNRISVSGSGAGVGRLYRDPVGSIWSTAVDGGCRFAGDECATLLGVPSENQPLSGGPYRPGERDWRLAVDGDHRLWAYVAKAGLFAFENGHWSPIGGAPSGPGSGKPTTQYTDAGGRIWFGLQDGRLLSVTNGLVHLYSSKDGLTLGEINAIDSVGTHIWAGGENGLALLRGPRFAPVLPYDAPAFSSVSGIIEAPDGSLWLNENRGVVHVSAAEVSAMLHDSSHLTSYEILDSEDGFPGTPVHFDIAPTAISGTDGRLWFATSHGVAWVNPQHLHRNQLPPPVIIQSVVADGRTLLPSGKLELPGKTNNLQIAYAGLSLSVPERVQYRYRLKGLDQEWQNAGTRRTAYYTRLAPGSYDFQVVAANDAGVWNRLGANLAITIVPTWYQTWWFYALSTFLVLTALAGLYRLRLAQVRAETRRLLEARLTERVRIARDLHDTLLQGMQGLIWRFRAATNRIPPEQPARQLMEQSLDRAEELLGESRDRVKDLRPVTYDVVDLAQSLAAEGEQFANLYPAKFRVSVQGAPRDLHPIVREEGFLIAREALGNAFRHSGAKDVEVDVTYDEGALHVRVRDDGRGITAPLLEPGGRPGHFGLVGMRERAKKLGGQLDVWTKTGAGTEIDLRVPAKVAYRRSLVGLGRARSWLAALRSTPLR
jgi:signal transduction histidine kinase/ligand-binding sensor domain-containing protein